MGQVLAERRWTRWAAAAAGGMLLAGIRAWGQADPNDPLTALNNRPASRPATQPADTGNSDPQLWIWRRRFTGTTPEATTMGASVSPSQLADSLTDQQVRAAIKRGSDYLLQQLTPDGKVRHLLRDEQRPWLRFAGDQEVGVISMGAYALLEAGRFTDDPRLKPFSKEMTPLTHWIINAQTGQTYSVAFQANVLSLLPPRPEVKKAQKRVRDQLANGMREDGGYSYTLGPSPQWDNSNTQYGLLGLWAISEAGVETPQHFWSVADAHWRQTQGVSGGWAYKTPIEGFIPNGQIGNATTTPTLTAAGVASLFVTLDHLNGGARNPAQDKALERGLAAVESDFGHNLPLLGESLYYAYGIQRVGVASGLKYIDHINWYRRGAAAMLLSEDPNDGSWTYGYSKLVGTAYALLFLTHGGSPVVFNKLQYAGAWNSSPRDDANLTHRLSHTLEMPLNWQIVSMDSDPQDWLDAPVLLLTGHDDPHFGAPEIEKLRTYIHAGGIVFSIADGGDEAFTTAIRAAAAQATGGQYPMRELPPDHPLFTLYEKVKEPPKLLAISNGTRELWIHSPLDFAATWQHLAYSEKERWSIPLNLFFYATGRTHPHNRLDSLEVRTDALPPDGRLAMARVAYAGNADPEPGAWPRFARILKRDIHTRLNLATVDVAQLDARLTPLAHITGNDHVAFAEPARQQLRAFLQQGGTLIGDSTGGAQAFTESFLDLTRSLAPDSQIDILPAESPLFDGSLPDTVRIGKDQATFRKGTPLSQRASGRAEIWAWKVNGRYAILFSPLDITSGLLGTETWGIAGYTPDFSQTLARDLVLYAAAQSRVASTMPDGAPAAPATAPAPAVP